MARRASPSKVVVYVALTGNLLVTLTKFGAAWWTGSSAMLSEAVHSLVDTSNQLLLLYGLHRGTKPADNLVRDSIVAIAWRSRTSSAPTSSSHEIVVALKAPAA
jgi:Cation efflux family